MKLIWLRIGLAVLFVIGLILMVCKSVGADIILPVPHLMEYGGDSGIQNGAMTCGPCSLEMCVAYIQHRDVSFTNVRKINAAIHPERANDQDYLSRGDFTGCDQLIAAAKQVYDLENLQAVDFSPDIIRQEINAGRSVIVTMATYGVISNRQDKYSGSHILVVNGFSDACAICQDPDNTQTNACYNWDEVTAAVGDYHNYQMIIGFNSRPVEEAQKSLANLKGRFFQGIFWQFFGPSVTYKAWVVEQVGNHLLLVEEKSATTNPPIRIIDLMSCFLRVREKTPIGNNCLVIETNDVDNFHVGQPADEMANSWIYLNLHQNNFLYQTIRQKDQATINIGLSMVEELPPLPPEITVDVLAKDKAKWFTP